MTLPGYDAWKTGGDGHTHTDTYVCDYDDCKMYGVPVEETTYIEYGLGDQPECRVCGYYLTDADDFDWDAHEEREEK